MNNREKGNTFEEKAVKILEAASYKIIERNYRNRYAEIDIIAEKEKKLVFVEVKYRKSKTYGLGYEAVDTKKIEKIFSLAQEFLEEKNYTDYSLRFDCISFYGKKCDWIKNMAWGDEIGFW